MRACLTGTSCRGNATLLVLAGVACFAFVCSRFWVIKCRTRRPVKNKCSICYDTDPDKRKDRISQLPDDVISLIISRLSTKYAVRTSVLSRRWRHAYTYINEVRFSSGASFRPCNLDHEGEKLVPSKRKFVQAVDTVLQHHSGSKIMSFELNSYFLGCISYSFRKWMNSVGNLRVEQLTLTYYRPGCVSHPLVFSFDFLPEASSVKSLCLWGCSFQTLNQNALKDLTLKDVALTSKAVECILSNCSSLQSLKLDVCVLPSKLRIHGRDLQLKILTLIYCSNVSEIDLSAINLITFELCYMKMPRLSFSYVPLLQNLFFYIYAGEVPSYLFGKAAKDLPHLKCMFLQTKASFFEGFKFGGVNKLSDLRQLVLLLKYYNKLDLLSLATVLDACPLLHKFHLSMMVPSTFNGWLSTFNGWLRAKTRVVRCHSHLKEVEFSGFCGTKNEYNFILYILKNVVSLKRLSIFLNPRYYDVERGWVQVENSDPKTEVKQRRIIHKRLQGQAISKTADFTLAL